MKSITLNDDGTISFSGKQKKYHSYRCGAPINVHLLDFHALNPKQKIIYSESDSDHESVSEPEPETDLPDFETDIIDEMDNYLKQRDYEESVENDPIFYFNEN